MRSAGSASTHQDGGDPDHHEPGVPLGAAREPGEEALLRRDVAELRHELPEARQPAEQAGPDEPPMGQRDERGHERQRHQEGDATTLTPAAPMARRICARNSSRPVRLIATVTPENKHRPAGGDHGRDQCLLARHRGRPARMLVEPPPELLAIAGHDQQAVVDAEAQAEHGDHVDHGGIEVDQEREGEQRRERTADRGDRADDRQPGREESAEDQHHHQQADRQGDDLAGDQVLLHLAR